MKFPEFFICGRGCSSNKTRVAKEEKNLFPLRRSKPFYSSLNLAIKHPASNMEQKVNTHLPGVPDSPAGTETASKDKISYELK